MILERYQTKNCYLDLDTRARNASFVQLLLFQSIVNCFLFDL